MLSMHEDIALVREALAQGACGYMMKNAAALEFEQAIRTISATGGYFSASISQGMLRAATAPAVHADCLTDRQLQILTLLAEGRGAKQIAFQLGLSSKTVDTHRARIMERLGLNDVASLTRYAVRNRLVKA
jgi:DNA-binding NarL/FixJ family response regulator